MFLGFGSENAKYVPMPPQTAGLWRAIIASNTIARLLKFLRRRIAHRNQGF
jgi:hypothetical protein